MTTDTIKKHLLIYAHYYYPDVASTGQILTELAEGMTNTFDITVICTVPSYTGIISDNYKTKRFYIENHNGVKIIRIRVPEFKKTNKISRIINILTYYFGAKKITRKLKKIDYILTITQPPILGGMLGVYGKKKLNAKLLYNIQDFNPEQICAVKYTKNKFIVNLMLKFDTKSCEKADKIIIVGRDQYFTLENRFTHFDKEKCVLINNWIDEKSIFPLSESDENVQMLKKSIGIENKFVFMYSGNIGLYYDLKNILKVISDFPADIKSSDGRNVVFLFIGEGSQLNELKCYVKENHMQNVLFAPYQNKDKLNYSLNSADVHFCVNAKGIKGVSCPSKFYGIAAAGKPVLGVLEDGTEIRSLIEESKCGLCSDPGDYIKLKNNIKWFIETKDISNLREMGQRGRKLIDSQLRKDTSINKYIEVIRTL